MGKIISLNTYYKSKKSAEIMKSGDLTRILQEISQRRKEKDFEKIGRIIQLQRSFQAVFLKIINQYLIEKQQIEVGLFHCALYVAGIAQQIIYWQEDKYYAVDFLLEAKEKNNPFLIQAGADFCFIVCAFFPEFAERRNMAFKDYVLLGKTFYWHFYLETSKEIGFLMSKHFTTMQTVTQKVLQRIEN